MSGLLSRTEMGLWETSLSAFILVAKVIALDTPDLDGDDP